MGIVELVTELLDSVNMLLRAKGERDAEEAAAMRAQEALKKFADARKFPNG